MKSKSFLSDSDTDADSDVDDDGNDSESTDSSVDIIFTKPNQKAAIDALSIPDDESEDVPDTTKRKRCATLDDT
jgi:hypothetical protein